MPFGLLLMRSFMVYLMDKVEKIVPSLTPEQLMDEQPAMSPYQTGGPSPALPESQHNHGFIPSEENWEKPIDALI